MTSGPDPITKGSDPLGRLLQLSSPSPPSPAAVARARRTIEREWVGVVRRRRRVAWILVVAAALVCALALGLVLDVLESSIETVAELTVTSGGVTVTTPTGAPDQAASMLGAGTLIETGRDGRAALSLATGVDLLLDSSSHLRLEREDLIALRTGGLYFDSGPDPSGAPKRSVVVTTPFARLWNLGTRFEVRAEPDRLEIAVRTGRVVVETPDGSQQTIGAGEVLAITAGGATARSVLRSHERYGWTRDEATPFAIDGRTLGEFFAWIEREAGLEVRLVTEADVRSIRLYGDLVWRDPLHAIDPTLRLAGLKGFIDDGALYVGP